MTGPKPQQYQKPIELLDSGALREAKKRWPKEQQQDLLLFQWSITRQNRRAD